MRFTRLWGRKPIRRDLNECGRKRRAEAEDARRKAWHEALTIRRVFDILTVLGGGVVDGD